MMPERPPVFDDEEMYQEVRADTTTKTRWTVGELLAADFPEPDWIVPGMIPIGLTYLAGRPKIGKSWLALQLAHSKATGGIFLQERVSQGNVLFIALED